MAGNLSPLDSDNSRCFTDVQKTFSLLVSWRIFSLKEVGKRFCPVGVRWLGFLTSILHSALTYPKLRDILEGIPASDIQNKTVKSLIKNTIHCLDKVNCDHKDIVFKIFQFSVVYFKFWRKVVMSNGTNILEVTIDTRLS